MKPTTLERISVMAEGLLLQGEPTLTVDSVHFDSRQLEAGGLFVAIRGAEQDGHKFILQAAKNGARAAIISKQSIIPHGLPATFGLILVNDTLRAYQKLSHSYRRQFAIPFIAVTGSNGKTTTKDIISYVLSTKIPLYKTYKNLNTQTGLPYSLLQIDDSHQTAVLELGMSEAGQIDILASLVEPEVSVITYIGDSHLEFFESREQLALAKGELLPHTNPDGLVLLNGDNQYVRKIAHLYEGTTLYYSVEGPADIWAENIVTDEHGTSFDVRSSSGNDLSVKMPLFGKHNVLNALPAIAIARHYGISEDSIKEALSTVSLSAMRFEITRSPSGAIVVNDAYNASPASMEAAITTFADIFPERKKVLVLGDMFELGEESRELHTKVGEYANRFRDRFSLLLAIGEDIRYLYEAYQGNKRLFATKQEALTTLQELVTTEYAILFKASRGMELETLAQKLTN